MSYVPPSSPIGLVFTVGYAPPAAGSINLDTAPAGDIRQAGGIATAARVGAPRLIPTQILRPRSVEPAAPGTPFVQKVAARFYPSGIANEITVSTPTYVAWRRFLYVAPGVEEPIWATTDARIELVTRFYAPPAFNLILNWDGTSYIAPSSPIELSFGLTSYGDVRGITLADQARLGVPRVTQTPAVQPVGIPPSNHFPLPVITNRNFAFRPSGWASSGIGAPDVALSAAAIPRTITAVGIAVPPVSETHAATHFTQFIDVAGRGISASAPGTPAVGDSSRTLSPLSIICTVFGNTAVARNQTVGPGGWASSTVPPPYIAINLQQIGPSSGVSDPARYGAPTVRNQHELLHPLALDSQAFGTPRIYNFTQYVRPAPYMDTNSDPTQWPQYAPFVENRNRVIRPQGWPSSRFSLIATRVYNNAVVIAPLGINDARWGAADLGYRIRQLAPTGWTSSFIDRYSRPYNAARIIAPTSLAPPTTGAPERVANLNRTIRHAHPSDSGVVSPPFVSFSIRTVRPQAFNDIPFSLPEVRRNPHPITLLGIDSTRYGGIAEVFERFNNIGVPSVNVFSTPRVGAPHIANRNRELGVQPNEHAAYGRPRVYNATTYVFDAGTDTSHIGAAFIGRRTREMVQAPISTPVISVLHRIRNAIPDPPAERRIAPRGWKSAQISDPVLSIRAVYPAGFASGGFGRATLVHNTLTPRSMFTLDQCGTPQIIGTQYVYPYSTPWPRGGTEERPHGSSDENYARPTVTPFYIFPRFPRIDSESIVGHPAISNQHRAIQTTQDKPHTTYGFPTIELKNHTINPLPIRSLRMGYPVFWGAPQTVSLDALGDGIASANQFGGAAVAHLGADTQYVHPPGVEHTRWGDDTYVELKNRVIMPPGIPHRGNPEQGAVPPWGRPILGRSPQELGVGAGDLARWGTTWLSHRVRDMPLQGWDSALVAAADYGAFAQRMRVIRRNPPGGIPGIASTARVGSPSVSFGVRSIQLYGFTGRFGVPTIQRALTLAPTGWDSSAFGNVERWEPGKIKPLGVDTGSVGTPRVARPVYAAGADAAAVGSPRVARPLYFWGLQPPAVTAPSVTNPSGCGLRVILPLPILSPPLPSPSLT